jgi:hypothetical protein
MKAEAHRYGAHDIGMKESKTPNLWTADRDFGRSRGLKVRNPLAA